LLVVIADAPRPVEDARALALRRFEQVRRVDVLHVERRVLAHQHRREARKRPVLRVACRVPVVIVGGELERTHPRARRAVAPVDFPLLEREHALAARGDRAHHRDARVLVRLQQRQRIEYERKIHEGGGGRGDRASYRIRSRVPAASRRRQRTTCPAPARSAGQRASQPSYLNESCSRVRYASTLPFSILTSSFVTSAIRRSRSDLLAVSTALRAASSHDVSLLPTTSMTR